MTLANTLRAQPDADGHFGYFGGRYVSETLMPLILELEREYRAAQVDIDFHAELDGLLRHFVGRPSPLYYAEGLTKALRQEAPLGKGPKIYFKREDLNHTGAHKINNCVGQILLAIRMGKTGSSPRRALASTASPRLLSPRASVCLAPFQWAQKTSRASSPTSSE